MPLYLIRRDLGSITQEELDAAAIRALSCVYNYDGLRWVTSYWNPSTGQIYCIYEAQAEQQIIDHSAQSRIPCNEVTLVQRVDPEEYATQLPWPVTEKTERAASETKRAVVPSPTVEPSGWITTQSASDIDLRPEQAHRT